jgi:hypothetical protein
MPMDSNKFGAYGTWVVGISGLLWTVFTYFNPKPEVAKNNQSSTGNVDSSSKSITISEKPKTIISQKESNILKPKPVLLDEPSKLNNNYFSYSGIENTADKEEIALLILNENDKIAYDLEVKIVEKLKRNGFGATGKFFKNQFIYDGLFEKLYDGDRDLLRRLNISTHADYIFLGKTSIKYIDNDQNTKTSIGKLSGVMLNTKNGNILNQVSINERGEGFYLDDAEESVMIKITQQFPVNF